MPNFPIAAHCHGFEPFISGTSIKLLSNSQPITALRPRPPQSLNSTDRFFLDHLHELYGDRPFVRGYLDAGRINRLFGDYIVPSNQRAFNARSRGAHLTIRRVP